MSKRRISIQQSARIHKRQQQYQQADSTENPHLSEGLVISRFRNQALIETEQDEHLICTIRPTLANIVAGDRIIWSKEGVEQGVIVSLHPRTSVLARVNTRGESSLVAANITQIIVVVTIKPTISFELLDSYLVMAEILNIPCHIVLNKTDLECEKLQMDLAQIYPPLGYTVLYTNHSDPRGDQALQALLNHQISVFVGQSGVGKSSIISRLLPLESSIATSEISKKSELGRHTTSNAYFYHLPSGGALIDSPGVREFGLWNINAADVFYAYREFRPLINQCKFRNCNHQNAPYCAILEAVNNHIISPTRYENCVRIIKQFSKK